MGSRQQGFALITVLIMVVVLGVLLAAHFITTMMELSSVRATADSTSGFYAAEAGLNIRGEQIRQRFIGYQRPAGTSPSSACQGGDPGAGDYACQDFEVGGRNVRTYVVEDAGNGEGGEILTILDGVFAGLNAIQYRYGVFADAVPPRDDRPEARLEMVFRSRLVPLFQFAAFYNKDLEILPGPPMTLDGRVHVNGDLYLNAGNTLDINGQVTVSQRSDDSGGGLYRGRKDRVECIGVVRVDDARSDTAPNPAVPCSGLVGPEALAPWSGRIATGLEYITVPEPAEFLAEPGARYWDAADLRLVLDLGDSPAGVEVRLPDGSVDADATAFLQACPSAAPITVTEQGRPRTLGGVAGASASFYNYRENRTRGRSDRTRMLEVDVRGLMECIHQRQLAGPGDLGELDDAEGGGLVWHLSVIGPDSDGVNSYGVRLRNAAELAAVSAGAPEVRGLTIVSDQAVYLHGHYNSVDKKPAAVMADSLNVLSEGWSFSAEGASGSSSPRYKPAAADTVINAAFLAGTDSTGGQEGAGGQNRDDYNGGLENYPRFHEDWSGRTLTYRGSFVSLGLPQHVVGTWGNQVYEPPNRNWNYDTDFNDAANLPPMTPRFVYLIQEMFVREFER